IFAVLHAKGIVHHDVNPSNLLRASFAPLTVKLCDFSAATKEGRPLTRDPWPIGTKEYMAPADRAKARNEDFWGLGVTSIELLCGDALPRVGESEPFAVDFIEQVQTAYSQKHGATIPACAVRFLRLLFDAYNPELTADTLLEYLAALEAGQE